MKYIVDLERDTDNSYPGTAELRVNKNTVPRTLEIVLKGEDRTVELKIDDIVSLLKAHGIVA